MKAGLSTLLTFLGMAALLGCEAPRPEPLRIGYIDWPGYEILYLAQQKSFLQQEKAPVLLKDFTSFSDLLKALQVGRLDGAAMSINEMLLSRLGKDYRVVFVLDVSHGADGIVGQQPIRSFKELKRKRIGVELKGLGGYVLTRALQKAGMDASEITRINMTATIEAYSAFMNKEVDAVVTFEPVLSRLIAEQRGNLLFTSREIPDEIINVLIFHVDALKNRRQDCLKVLQGYLKAREFWKKEPEDAVNIMARRERIPPDYFKTSLNGLLIPDLSTNLTYFGLADTENYFLESLRNFQGFMEENRLSYEPVYFENLLTDLKGVKG